MFFFYGWGTSSKVLKYGTNCQCPACNCFNFFNIVVQYSYFSLFFIPIIKWNKKYFLQCPNCGSVMPIDKQTYLDIKNGVKPAPAEQPPANTADPFAEVSATTSEPATEVAETQPEPTVEPVTEAVQTQPEPAAEPATEVDGNTTENV